MAVASRRTVGPTKGPQLQYVVFTRNRIESHHLSIEVRGHGGPGGGSDRRHRQPAGDKSRRAGGLEHAVLLTNNLDLAGRTFVVEKVQVRQAPALLEVIQRAFCDPKRKWVVRIPSTLKLRHIARISNEIEVVVAVVIPQLLRDNVDPTGARLLRRYAWSICHAARKVDGALFEPELSRRTVRP